MSKSFAGDGVKPIKNSIVLRLMCLRREGASYKEIARNLGIGIGTSHKYAKNVKVSAAGALRLKRKLIKKQNHFKHCFATPKAILKTRKLTLSKVRLIAHCLFDGSVIASDGDYIIKYTNASWELIQQFMNDMREAYGLDPSYIELNKGRNHPWWKCDIFQKELWKICLGIPVRTAPHVILSYRRA